MAWLATVWGGVTTDPATANGPSRTVRARGIAFTWRHAQGRLHGSLSAETTGWLAVGFNDKRTLRGTRFVIGRVVDGRAHAEVHIARVPDHAEVGTLGGVSGLADVAGGRTRDETWLTFSLPLKSGDDFEIDLSPGRKVLLMLGWSLSPDFDHHSRVREHRDVVL